MKPIDEGVKKRFMEDITRLVEEEKEKNSGYTQILAELDAFIQPIKPLSVQNLFQVLKGIRNALKHNTNNIVSFAATLTVLDDEVKSTKESVNNFRRSLATLQDRFDKLYPVQNANGRKGIEDAFAQIGDLKVIVNNQNNLIVSLFAEQNRNRTNLAKLNLFAKAMINLIGLFDEEANSVDGEGNAIAVEYPAMHEEAQEHNLDVIVQMYRGMKKDGEFFKFQ